MEHANQGFSQIISVIWLFVFIAAFLSILPVIVKILFLKSKLSRNGILIDLIIKLFKSFSDNDFKPKDTFNNFFEKEYVNDFSDIEHRKRTHLLTPTEQEFYHVLKKAIWESWHIHCQTSLIALTEPVEYKEKVRAYSKRVDFVIANEDSKIICVIELDDKSHEQAKRKKRDEYMNHALSGIHPFLRYKVANHYDPEKIRKQIEILADIH